jgi:hypothetical protein
MFSIVNKTYCVLNKFWTVKKITFCNFNSHASCQTANHITDFGSNVVQYKELFQNILSVTEIRYDIFQDFMF